MNEKEAVATNLLMELSALKGDYEAVKMVRTDKVNAILETVKGDIRKVEEQYEPELIELEKQIERLESRIKRLCVLSESSFSPELSDYAVIYYNGRISWQTKALDGYAQAHPEILRFRKQGKPYSVIRKK